VAPIAEAYSAGFSIRVGRERRSRTPAERSFAVRILVCDNEQSLRTLVRASLEIDNGHYDIAEAADGDEALTLARRLRPDLILLDMMMPGRTGLDVLEELRADEELAETPVVMLTARVQVGDRAAADAAGADRFLAKPFSPIELSSVVAELLEARA
jgi:two-component system, OmpR family, phosphate regulon response regulator PhoB